jgi:hypothetical protein
MADTAAVYAETRESLRDLVAGLSEEELAANVPATPAWSVRDVVAHLVGEARITNTGDAPPEFRLLESLRDPAQADLRDRINGEEPGATLTGDRFELFRALAGRRSRRQIEALDWEGDREPYVALVPADGERLDDVVE